MSLIILLDSEPLGLATNPKSSPDADVILCAQAATLDPAIWGLPGASVVIATGNVGHLTRLADARRWQDIAD